MHTGGAQRIMSLPVPSSILFKIAAPVPSSSYFCPICSKSFSSLFACQTHSFSTLHHSSERKCRSEGKQNGSRSEEKEAASNPMIFCMRCRKYSTLETKCECEEDRGGRRKRKGQSFSPLLTKRVKKTRANPESGEEKTLYASTRSRCHRMLFP